VKQSVLTFLIVCVFVVVVLILLSGLTVYFKHQPMTALPKPPEHGTVFVIEADFSQARGNPNALAALKETIMRRLDKYGTRIYWEPVSDTRARVSTPVTDAKALGLYRTLISQGGHLEFHLVHPASDQLVLNGTLPASYELLAHQEIQPSGRVQTETVVAKTEPAAGLTGNIVQRAMVVRDPLRQPQIEFILKPENAAAFAELTGTNIHHQLAIVLDGQLYSAPMVQSRIPGGHCEITGKFDEKEARRLTTLIQYPLPVPVTLVELKTF
jgi:preprotein translocase subunit SecD